MKKAQVFLCLICYCCYSLLCLLQQRKGDMKSLADRIIIKVRKNCKEGGLIRVSCEEMYSEGNYRDIVIFFKQQMVHATLEVMELLDEDDDLADDIQNCKLNDDSGGCTRGVALAGIIYISGTVLLVVLCKLFT